jgi:hypothetical protein
LLDVRVSDGVVSRFEVQPDEGGEEGGEREVLGRGGEKRREGPWSQFFGCP